MKAEELKQKAKNSWMDKREFKYVFNEHELQQYADEVSRERAVNFELRHVYKGASKAAKRLAYMQFDDWLKEQEEQ